MAMRFNPPPGWPTPPEGFVPDAGWRPDPGWPPAPPDWQFWVPDETRQHAPGGMTPGGAGYQQQGPGPAGYGAHGAWGPGVPPPPGTSGMAIASFVLGLVGFIFGVPAIVGIVLGIVALRELRRRFQSGKGLAIAGIVIGSAWLALWVVIIVAAALTPTTGSSASPPSAPQGTGGRVDPFTLKTGDCFDNPTPTSGQVQHITSVVQTQCTQPHNAQIFATFNVSGSPFSYPGDAKMRSLATDGCSTRSKTSLDATQETSEMTIRFLLPGQGSWLSGRRTISCIIFNPTPTLTSSLLKS
ncbi:MAG: DUF4190 domain-containing protein [Actinobacteria bacterium]|nr:DUF4190 domain-containing protein [Actinomycetota bacterium]MBO0837053.1 DUF4190 domain-containing protein [Actinomycetota bacterium]